MIQIENLDEVYNWDVKQLWSAMNLLDDEERKLYKKDLEKIKYGINIRIPIVYIIYDWIDDHPENRRVSVKGFGKYDIIEFYDEIDERERLMRQIIFDTYDEGTTRPRN